MREIINAKQTQVHPCNPSQGWCGGLVQSRSRHLAESAGCESSCVLPHVEMATAKGS
jgi:hypothetical protein